MTDTTAHDVALVETVRRATQNRFDAGRPAAERNRLGQFATPNALAVEIVREALSLAGGQARGFRFADPALGTGSFYSAALAVLGRERIAAAVGVELDPALAGAAHDLWAGYGLEVVRGDFTQLLATDPRLGSPNLVLANPPYVRHHHLSRDDKERLKRLTFERAGVEVNGLAGLYVYFLLLTTAWMEEGGVAAWLIPSEFMDVNYGAALKKYLCDRVTLVRVHRFDPEQVQFDDALVSSAVLTFRKVPPAVDHRVRFTFGGTIANPAVDERIPVGLLRLARKWTACPSRTANACHAPRGESGPTLGDLFRVQRGIATGCNGFFILDRTDARARGLPASCLRPILPSPRQLKSTVIEGESDGYPRLDRPLCVIDCDLPERDVERKFPALWEYLRTADRLGVRDRYLIGKRDPWYKQERRPPPAFLCTYMGRGTGDRRPFRFIWNQSQAIGTNLYLMLYPLGGLGEMLRRHPARGAEVLELLQGITGHELRDEGRVYGGGLHKIEPGELARISAAPFIDRWPELRSEVRRSETPNLFDTA